MSYRTYINDQEWLGNNVYSSEIMEELKRQGCDVDDEGIVLEDFEVKDFDALVKATDAWIEKEIKAGRFNADFSNAFEDARKQGYVHEALYLYDLSRKGYLFLSARLMELVGRENVLVRFDKETREPYLALREGVKCLFKAF